MCLCDNLAVECKWYRSFPRGRAEASSVMPGKLVVSSDFLYSIDLRVGAVVWDGK